MNCILLATAVTNLSSVIWRKEYVLECSIRVYESFTMTCLLYTQSRIFGYSPYYSNIIIRTVQ